MRLNKIIFVIFIVFPSMIMAVPSTTPGGFQNNSSSNITYSGVNIFSSDTIEDNKNYTSSNISENAILVTGGVSTINSCTVNKSGDSNSDDADFYGINAGILVSSGTLNIKSCKINTNGSHANAVFAYKNGIINISDTVINTESNNSGGVMVTGGGVLNATNLTVKTLGNSSASIRSDRGGGTLKVTGGTYETNGQGSPVIYSTAEIVVESAKLTSTSSEGVVVEGANSVSLNNIELTDTNNTLNGNSETYKNIFLYQSMSGDAESGESTFTSKDSTITTNKGDTIFVTNTTSTINLENNNITNNDGDFLRIQTGKWGNSESNGGNVTLNMTNQKVDGSIIVDSISTLSINMNSNSVLITSIDNENQAKSITLKLSSDSILSLTNDSYVDSIENADITNSNIYSNGKYKLYVGGNEVTINQNSYTEDVITISPNNDNNETTGVTNNYLYIIIGISGLAVIACITIIILIKKNKTV